MSVTKEYVQYLKMIRKYNIYDNANEENFEFKYYENLENDKIRMLDSKLDKNLFENELLHIEAILGWLLKNITHYGYNDIEVSYNIIDIFKSHMENGIGASCMMLAFCLRDILEAYGYHARVIQGCPFNPEILDSHWLVLWYSSDLRKWVMLDPTWGAYCKKDGVLLSAQEIRDMLTRGIEFDMCIQAKISKEYYHFLLCRYLFQFNSFCYNGFNMFEHKNQYRINLAPIGFDAEKYFKKRYELEEQNIRLWMKKYVIKYNKNTIYTNDCNRFWRDYEMRK